MSETPIPTSRYVLVWAILVAALAISLGLGALGMSSALVVVVFAIAAVKAWLVLRYFMHLRGRPLMFPLLLLGAVAVIAVLYFGLVPDIVWVHGRMEGGT